MDFLVDTHLLLWTSVAIQRLSFEAREIIEDPGNRLFFSAVSFCEIAIKRSLNRPDFQPDPQMLRNGLLKNGYSELPLTATHAFGILSLPLLHKDPFDRMLIAQATIEGMTFLTSDAQIAVYPGPIRKV
jgi:PIN domain nuclease of toxin-antitoxin system